MTKYALYSGNKKIQENTDGEFRQVDASKFTSGEDVSVKVYGTEKTVKTQLLLEVKDKKPIILNEVDFSKAGLSFTLDDDVPFVGGSEIKLNFPNIPVNVVVEDGKVKVGVNIRERELYSYNSYEGVTTTTKRKKKSIKERIKDWEKDVYKTGLINQDWKGYLEKGNLKADIPFVKEKKEVTVFGYAESEWSDSLESIEGEIIIAVSSSKTTMQKPLLIFNVPVTVNCSVKWKAGANAALKYDFIKRQWVGDVGLNGSVAIEPYAGVGVGTWLSAGVYGQLTGGIEATLLKFSDSLKMPGVDSVYLTGEAGVKGYFAKEEVVRVPLLSFENLRNSGFGPYIDSRNRLLIYSRTDNSLFHRKTAKSIANSPSNPVFTWNKTAASSFCSSAAGDLDSVLVENAYGAAEPQMVSTKDTTLAVWLDNEESRALSNQTVVKYAVYDPDTERFTDCGIALDDGTADYKPQLYTDGEDIYLYYQDSTKCFEEGEDPDISEYAGTFAVTVAKYDTVSETFVKMGTVQRGNNYCYAPVLTKTEDGLLLAWVENESGDVFGLSEDNSVNYSVYTSGQWSEPEAAAAGLNSITSLAAGNFSGTETIAYCMDTDNNLTTPEQKLYLADRSGEVTERMEAPIAGLSFMTLPDTDQSVLLYNQEGAAAYIMGESDEPMEILAEGTMDTGSRMQVCGNRIYYLKSSDSSRNIYCAVYDGEKWGSVPLTEETSYVDSFSFADNRGIYLKTEAKILANEEVDAVSEIRILDDVEKHDLKIESADFDAWNIEAGEDLELTLAVTNHGTQTAESPSVIFYPKNNPGDCQNLKITGSILPGETVYKTVSVTAPTDFTDAVYRIEIEETGEEDQNREDNQFEIDLSKTELCVTAEYQIEQEQKLLVVHVSNYSNVSAAADVKVRSTDGADLYVKDGIEVLGQETVDLSVPVEESWFGGNKETVLTAEVCTNEKEYYDSNNVCEQRIWEIETWEPVVSDLSDEKEEEEIFSYELNSDGTAVTITKCTKTDADITIPSTMDGYPVMGIGKEVFSGSNFLKTLRFPKSVTLIQENAFLNSKITEIYYGGTKEDWKKIKIEQKGNTALLNAVVKGTDGKTFPADQKKWSTSGTGNSQGGQTPVKKPSVPQKQPSKPVVKKPTVPQKQPSKPIVTKPSVPKVKSFKVKAGRFKLMLSWKKVAGASGYQIQVAAKKNFKIAYKYDISKNKKKYVEKWLMPKKKYYVRIRAYKTYRDASGFLREAYGPWSKKSKKVK